MKRIAHWTLSRVRFDGENSWSMLALQVEVAAGLLHLLLTNLTSVRTWAVLQSKSTSLKYPFLADVM